MSQLDCEPSLYFAISGPRMADSLVWPCGIMQVGEWGESRIYYNFYNKFCTNQDAGINSDFKMDIIDIVTVSVSSTQTDSTF